MTSPALRVVPSFNAANIPAELLALPQWVCWRYEQGDGPKPKKVPYDPRTGLAASVTDPTAWRSSDEAIQVASVSGTSYDGIGFVLTTNDPYAIIDLDDTQGDAAALEKQRRIYDAFDSYTELSPSRSIEEMTVPRLTACNANLANVVEIQGVMQDGKRNTFSLQDDLEQVAHWLTHARGQGNPFAMLVIDPVTSYLPGQKLRKVDLNDAGQLRTVLEPWLILAQTHNIAIVCVTHFAKDTNRAMLHRVLGSAAFAQTCRSLCAVIEQPRTEDEEPDPHAKVFMQVKVNLPEHPGGSWRFHTERVEVGTDHRNGKPIYATRPAWDQLDPALTPNSTVGKSRGPKSQYEPQFAMWFQAFYTIYPNHEWLPVSTVKQVALQERVISASWWDKHSGDHMDKENVNGTWMCRPKQTAPAKE